MNSVWHMYHLVNICSYAISGAKNDDTILKELSLEGSVSVKVSFWKVVAANNARETPPLCGMCSFTSFRKKWSGAGVWCFQEMDIQHELCRLHMNIWLECILLASWFSEARGKRVDVVTGWGKPVKFLF